MTGDNGWNLLARYFGLMMDPLMGSMFDEGLARLKLVAEEAPAEFLSTHPSSERRIDQLVAQFGTTLKLYNEAQQAGKTPDCSM